MAAASRVSKRLQVTRWLALVCLIVGIDQATKWLIQLNFSYAERFALLPVLDLTLVYNTGAAFSFLAAGSGWQRWVLIAIAIAAITLIVWMLRRHTGQRRFELALVLILAGAIGNLIDRVLLGHVVDFVLLHWRGWHYPAFNVADMSITFGAILILWDEWLRWRQQRTENSSIRSNKP